MWHVGTARGATEDMAGEPWLWWVQRGVIHGEGRVCPATPRNQNKNQPSTGQPQEAEQTYRNQTKLQLDIPSVVPERCRMLKSVQERLGS